ncbi:MFS transporter [uncultured Jatrophihabitans sp.]|uniref:MFS transporter n=1 Tax=uncultured Jatrophihabitans sp. TaxID=1610747 RepID=UPI0035CAC4BE
MTAALAQRVRERLTPGDAGFDRRLIVPMALGAVLNPINSSIIAVSLVPIGIAFGAPPSQTAWLVSGLYLATSIGQPVVGRLVDSFGPRRLFLAGATLTGVAGVLGTVAPNLPVLVVARVILGFGTCAGYPSAMRLIRSEAQRTGRSSPASVLTILSVCSQTVVVIGPTFGGLLIGLGGWRTTFAINVPLALACLLLGVRRLPREDRAERTSRHPSLDVPGIALFAATLVALLFFLVTPQLDRLWLVGVAVVAAAAFTVRELHTADPFIDLRLLGGNVPLLLTYARALMSAVISYSFLYGYTQWLEDSHGMSAAHAGLVLLPMSALAVAVSAITGRRPEIKAKLLVGQTTQVIACVLLLMLTGASSIWLLLLVTVVLGIPQGLNTLAIQNAVYFQADPERIGASAGLMRSFFYLGAIASSAVNGTFFDKTADTAGLHDVGIFTVAVACLGLLITVTDRSLARVGRDQTAEPSSKD